MKNNQPRNKNKAKKKTEKEKRKNPQYPRLFQTNLSLKRWKEKEESVKRTTKAY